MRPPLLPWLWLALVLTLALFVAFTLAALRVRIYHG